MESALAVQPNPVTLLKGGAKITRGKKVLGTTEQGQTWQAKALFWGKGKPPMLWVLDPADGSVGAWVPLEHAEGGGLGSVIVDFNR